VSEELESPLGESKTPAPAKPRARRVCLECGAGLEAAMRADAEFCCDPCCRRFNNRRLKRGAEFFDLFMSLRYDREAAKREGVWTLLCRLAQNCREQDERERDGRRSWQRPRRIIERRPYLNSVVVSRPKRRK
jgi:hypothetical protein